MVIEIDFERLFRLHGTHNQKSHGTGGGGHTITSSEVPGFLEDSVNKDVTYHATRAGEDIKSRGVDVEKTFGASILGQGFYTSTSSTSSQTTSQSQETLRVAVKVKKPYVGTAQEVQKEVFRRGGSTEARKSFLADDIDGLIVDLGPEKWVVGFKNENIKLVVD